MPVFKRLIQNPSSPDKDLKVLSGADRYKQSTFARLADVNALSKDVNDQKLYSVDAGGATSSSASVAITTKKGVVKITNAHTGATSFTLTLTNSELLAADVDKLNPCVFAAEISEPKLILVVGFEPSNPIWNANTNCLLTISTALEPVITYDNWESNANNLFAPSFTPSGNGQRYWVLSILTPSVSKSNTQILFNDSGSSNGTSDFTYDKITKTITIGNTSSSINIGNSSVNSSINSHSVNPDVGMSNKQTLDHDFTLSSGRNLVIGGPYTISTGKTMTIPTGSRLVIV